MMSAEDTIIHGHEVARALEVVEPVIDRMHSRLVKMLLEASPMEKEAILDLHAKAQAVAALKEDLRQAVLDGETASLIVENANVNAD